MSVLLQTCSSLQHKKDCTPPEEPTSAHWMLAGSRTARWFSNHASEFAAQNQFWPKKEDLQHPSAILWALQPSERPFYRQHLWSDWGPQGAQERQEQWLRFSSSQLASHFGHHFSEVTDVTPLWGASKQMEQMGPALAAVHQCCIPQAGSDSVPASAGKHVILT